jgi:hypothetical protein
MNCPELQKLFCVFALRSNRKKVRIRIASEGGLESENIRKELGGGRVWIPCSHVACILLAIQLSFVRCAAILTPSTFHLNIHSRHTVLDFKIILSEI